jgi:hypothetical protein
VVFVVVDAFAGHAAEVDETGEMASEQIARLLGGDHACDSEARIARHADDDLKASGVSVADRDIDRRLPQIPLGELPGSIVGALIGVLRQIERATRSLRIVIPRRHPIRSAITVAGMVGQSFSNART